jgi:hypothetical protein
MKLGVCFSQRNNGRLALSRAGKDRRHHRRTAASRSPRAAAATKKRVQLTRRRGAQATVATAAKLAIGQKSAAKLLVIVRGAARWQTLRTPKRRTRSQDF